MSIKDELAYIDNIEEFPSMPSVVLNLMSELNDPDISVSEIEDLINMDPALVTYVLKITNSLIFGIREEVYSISRAVTLIGMNNLKSLLSSYAIRLLCKSITHIDAQTYIWDHSLAVGVLARCIGSKVLRGDSSQAYVLGLLHDIGKIVLYIYDSSRYLKSLEDGILNQMDFVSSEKVVYGYSHIETGYLMAAKMQFSKKMKDIVLFHHNPEYSSPGSDLVWLISLCNELAHHMFDNKRVDLKRFLVRLNISDKDLARLVQVGHLEYQQYHSIF